MLSCSVVLTLCDSRDSSPPGSSVHGDSPGKNTGVDCHALFQRIFPTQGLNPGLPHCRWILYQLSHKGIPRILEWVAYPFSSGSSQPRNWTRVFCLAGGFFTNWAMSLLSEPSGKPQQRPTAAKKKKKMWSGLCTYHFLHSFSQKLVMWSYLLVGRLRDAASGSIKKG